MTLAVIILDEAQRLNIPMPAESYEMDEFPGIITGEMLMFKYCDKI